eukprot:183177-Rhodomonas_salina.2
MKRGRQTDSQKTHRKRVNVLEKDRTHARTHTCEGEACMGAGLANVVCPMYIAGTNPSPPYALSGTTVLR